MSEPPSAPLCRRPWAPWAAWVGLMSLFLAAGLAIPGLCRAHFWSWWGSQPAVIDRLAEAHHWEGALARVDRLIAERSWDPRPLQRRAELLRDQRSEARADALADPRVASAFEAAMRAHFRVASYPMLLSPSWRASMADTAIEWGATAARRGDWDLLALCLEYAADADPGKAPGLIRQLRLQTEQPQAMAPVLLASLIRLTLRHESADAALAEIARLRDHLPREDAALLLMEAELALPGQRVSSVSLEEFPRGEDFPPQRLMNLRWWHRGLEWRDDFYRPVDVDFWRGMNVGGPSSVLAFAEASPEHAAPVSPEAGWVLTQASAFEWQWSGGRDGGDRLWLIARGTPALGLWPVLEVTVNGEASRLVYVRSREWIACAVPAPREPLHSLRVEFLNDGGFPRLGPAGAGEILEDRNAAILGVWTEGPFERQADASTGPPAEEDAA